MALVFVVVNNHRHDMSISLKIELPHKSHNASDKYPTMHHFVTEMCTYVHISVTKWCIVGYGIGAVCDLCDINYDEHIDVYTCVGHHWITRRI